MDHFTRLYQGQPDSGGDLLYTVPTNYSAIIRDIEAINIEDEDGDSDWIIIWLLPPGITSPDDAYIIRPLIELGPGESAQWTGSRAIEEDCSLYAQTGVGTGSTGILNLVVTGVEVDETPAP